MHQGLQSLNVCSKHLCRRTGIRRASSKSIFTSFFFHNAQWLSPSPSAPAERTSFRGTTYAIPNFTFLTSSSPLSTYREAEVLAPPHILKLYAQLSKARLSILEVLTAMSGVALSPLPTVSILLSTALGTALCCASANTLNQLQEVPFDAQMARTRMRPLVRRAITPIHATGFAFVTGLGGSAILCTMVNPTTALLGAANITLYATIYTWMKRKSIANTWVGAVVGAVPALMGFTACGADMSLVDNPLAPFAFFMLLFSWQFPHFNSLSYLIRGSYAQAGYRMLSVLSPSQNALVALRYAILLVPICSVLIPLAGLTTWTFALTSLIPNAICTRAAWRFWRTCGENEARLMFRHSLWYLPAIFGLMMLHKQGIGWLQWLGFRNGESKNQTDIDVRNIA